MFRMATSLKYRYAASKWLFACFVGAAFLCQTLSQNHLEAASERETQSIAQLLAVHHLAGEAVIYARMMEANAPPAAMRAKAHAIAHHVDEINDLQKILTSPPPTGGHLPFGGQINFDQAVDHHIAADAALADLRQNARQVLSAETPLIARQLADDMLVDAMTDIHPVLTSAAPLHRAGLAALRDRLRFFEILVIGLIIVAIGVEVAIVVIPTRRESKRQQERLLAAETAADIVSHTNPLSGLPNEQALQRLLAKAPPGGVWHAAAFEYLPAFKLASESRSAITAGISATVGRMITEVEIEALIVAQISPGQFVAVFDDQTHDVPTQLDKLAGIADAPLDQDGVPVRVAFAAGLGCKRTTRSPHKMVDDAMIALKEARINGGGVSKYEPQMRRSALVVRRTVQELRLAIMSGHIRAYFQPQVDLTTGKLLGFEALARWDHHKRGILPPGAFMSVAEDTGLDEPLGESVMRLGLQALVEWNRRGWTDLTLGVNLAQSQLQNPRLVELVKWELDRFDIPPQRLTIEVLENIYVDTDDNVVVRNLAALSKLGVQIDLDDFGTGTASITGIRRYHTDRVKIDRSYISNIHIDQSKQKLVRTIVRMADSLGIRALAEGIEEAEELAFLRDLGCDEAQGYYYAKPMPFETATHWIENYLSSLTSRLDPPAQLALPGQPTQDPNPAPAGVAAALETPPPNAATGG